jgi:four helix bundle protein
MHAPKNANMRFEDLEGWKRSARLSADIYRELKDIKDFGFRDQITRSGLSIPSNIAKGFERKSMKEFMLFLKYALGSCGELRTQTHIGMEIGYLSKITGNNWIQKTKEISAMLTSLVKTNRQYLKETK